MVVFEEKGAVNQPITDKKSCSWKDQSDSFM